MATQQQEQALRSAKWFTRIFGIFYLLFIILLAIDLGRFGFNPESMHQIFHIMNGVLAVTWGWSNASWWIPWSFANGVLFLYAALFGFLFPDFGGLDAFNTFDTLLHTIVGITGITCGWISLSNIRRSQAMSG